MPGDAGFSKIQLTSFILLRGLRVALIMIGHRHLAGRLIHTGMYSLRREKPRNWMEAGGAPLTSLQCQCGLHAVIDLRSRSLKFTF